ncbi:MAG: NADH-quinone oxidoreductase subunit NuoG [Ilumatobacter sp.]|nr:NADH-quinone oxidoreductase subunit NuoG [Ilumatobacter sp.]
MTDVVDDTTASAPEPEPDPDAVAVTLNGTAISARKGELVIAAAERHGAPIPHFCYHPRMTPVGMCRQCLVEVDTGRGMQLQPSCMITVSPDMVIDTESPTAKRAQEGMIELLLANHPLDCPVCDKGGECPLQDQAYAHGPGESRFVEEKRHYEKPIPISDLVLLDRERCILCDRCTRFADEIAGDKLIHFTQRGNETQVMTFPDEPFASYFSGNTVQICPVGALTAEPYRFKARPWDLDQRESTCTTCAVGCRTVVQSSRDELLRYQGVDSDPVNHGWLCDRGRFNFEAVNSAERIADPLVRTAAGLEPTRWNGALGAAASLINDALAKGGPSSIAILGGARGTNEDAFAWGQLADAIDTPYRDAQLGDGLPIEVLGLKRATIDDAANAATVVLLGPDLKEELPVLYLRLRDAAVSGRSKLVEFSAVDTGLSRHAWRSIRHEPGTQHDAVAGAVADEAIAEQLAAGDVVIVTGRQSLAESTDATVAALQRLLDAVPDATVLPALRRGNVVGALSLGMAPTGYDAIDAMTEAAAGTIDVLVLVGADPLNDFPDVELARDALTGARHIISVDTHLSESTQLADVVLAAAAYGEKAGTTTNLEGRVTTVAHQVTATGTARPDWMIAVELASLLGDHGFGDGHPLAEVTTVDDVTDAIVATAPLFPGVTRAALAASPDGVMTLQPAAALPDVAVSVPARNRYDYRLTVSRTLYDRAVGTAMSPSLAGLAPGSAAHVNPLDLAGIGVDDGTIVQLISAKATVSMPVVGNVRVPRGVVWAPFNQRTERGGHIEDIIDAGATAIDVRIERS